MHHVLLALALVAVTHGFAQAREPNLCGQTSRAARHACENEARDDYWIQIGLCANGPAASRDDCRRAAKRAGREAVKECADQFAAREDLCDALGTGPYAPEIDPHRFLGPAEAATRPNRFFPLVPGTTWTYRKGSETTVVTVTNQTKVILGVTCIVVRDVVTDGGQLVEDTEDFFAQHEDGTVWYFGELSKGYENGELSSLDGSWQAGVAGAAPGILMPATPAVGPPYRQEFALGDAEDAGQILSVTGSATVPAASCAGTCIMTRDFSPLEPDAEEQKFYAPGIGLILEVEGEGGARVELVSFTAG